MPEMSLAALRPQDDSYDPFAAEKFVNPAVDAMGRGIAQQVATPGKLMAPNPWPEGSEPWQWYEDSKRNAAARWAPEMALSMIGSPAAVGGVPGTVGSGIKAYHSSPHDFDRFDLSKIGTGEGAQAYGHGLYFAESPAVSGRGGQYWKQFANRGSSGENTATEYLARADFDREKAAQTLRDLLANPPEYTSGYNKMTQERMRSEALKLLESDKHIGPRTYEVNINADPAHFLDWDKPLSGQSEAVREALSPQRLGLKAAGPLGEKGYYGWTDAQNRLIGRAQTKDLPAEIFDPREMAPSVYRGGGTWKPPEASERLREAGIPGIKYLDEGSRQPSASLATARQALSQIKPGSPGFDMWQERVNELSRLPRPTHNYVVFNPGIIDIMKKYGLAGLAPLAGYGAMQQGQQPSPQM